MPSAWTSQTRGETNWHLAEAGMRILVVDDDRSMKAAIEAWLNEAGDDAVVAEDGGSGVAAFDRARFDAVLVDIARPGMDGTGAIRNLRRSGPVLPIAAMSGCRSRNSPGRIPDCLDMAARLGAGRCLRKPFEPQDLVSAVRGCLEDCARSRSPGA